jgi:glycerol-3-phosphate dehydrogenase (NAD(P)+)
MSQQAKKEQVRVCVLSAGAWGTALALLLARNGHQVMLWSHEPADIAAIESSGFNTRYLPSIDLREYLNKNLFVTSDIALALDGARFVFQATPVQFLRPVLEQVRLSFSSPAVICDPFSHKISSNCVMTQSQRESSSPPLVLSASQSPKQPQAKTGDASVSKDAGTQIWVAVNKGIEQNTLLLPTQIIQDVLGSHVQVAALAGPSFAQELATQTPTAVTIAAPTCELGRELQHLLANNNFRPYISTDLIGVQVGAALKNVIALGMGMLEGAGYGANARAYLFTRGLAEIAQLSRAMGGKPDTVYGLSGVGDLLLTCSSSMSKNLTVGRKLGAGQPLDTIIRETGFIPEGVNTVRSAHQLATQFAVKLPICSGIHEILFGSASRSGSQPSSSQSIGQLLTTLMTQPLGFECEYPESF